MKRSIATAILIALAASVAAADTTTKPAKDKAKGPPSKVTAQQAMDVRTTKAKFMSAIGSCARPASCDPNSPARNPELVVMVQQAEEAFMQACVQCAADATCEQERARIRDGRGRFGYNACMQGDASAGTKSAQPAPEKKPK
jgi:hypothetical protein